MFRIHCDEATPTNKFHVQTNQYKHNEKEKSTACARHNVDSTILFTNNSGKSTGGR